MNSEKDTKSVQICDDLFSHAHVPEKLKNYCLSVEDIVGELTAAYDNASQKPCHVELLKELLCVIAMVLLPLEK